MFKCAIRRMETHQALMDPEISACQVELAFSRTKERIQGVRIGLAGAIGEAIAPIRLLSDYKVNQSLRLS